MPEVKKTEITAEDLQKSLAELTKSAEKEPTEETPVEKAVEQKPAEVKLAKSTAQAIAEDGSEDLKKTIDVSTVMADFANVLSKNTDNVLGELVKTINANHAINVEMVKALGAANERIESLEKTVAEALNLPQTPKAAKEDVLEKKVANTEMPGGEAKLAKSAGEIKDQVNNALLALRKTVEAGGDTDKLARLDNSIVEFDVTSDVAKIATEFLQPTLDLINGKQ